MAEILEKQICEACGADIRPKALFCFNCGSQVASDEEVQAEEANSKKISDAWFKEEIAPTPTQPAITEVAGKTAKKKTVAVEEKAKTDGKGKIAETSSSTKLRSAASLRDKSKSPEKKRVEVVWEEPSSAPNIWFLIVSLILVGFAVFILYAMLYIR